MDWSWVLLDGFPQVIDAVDGVPFPFDCTPPYQPHARITQKCTYAMGTTAVCDHKGRFTFISTQYVGPMHDSLEYKQSALYTMRQCISMGMTMTVMPQYQNTVGDQTLANTFHGGAWAVIENGQSQVSVSSKSPHSS